MGLIPGDEPSPQTAAKQTTDFLRFAAPSAVCEAEWRVMGEVAAVFVNTVMRPWPTCWNYGPLPTNRPCWLVAVRFFFRREVETNPQLFSRAGVRSGRSGRASTASGPGRLQDVLQNHGEPAAASPRGGGSDSCRRSRPESRAGQVGRRFREIYSAVSSLGEKLDRLH